MTSSLDPVPGVALFTDGSSYNKDRSGGWAWLAIDNHGNEERSMGGCSNTTNNRMEIQAWIEGLKFLYRAHGPCRVLVHSDSEYVGFGATNRRRNRKRNRDLWHELDAIIDMHEYVEFIHVRGHQKNGNFYNFLVDEMAGEARRAWSYNNESETSRL